MNAQVIPPRIRFQDKEVDFGLLSVDGSTEQTVSFKNESEIPIKWDLNENMTGLEVDDEDSAVIIYEPNNLQSSHKDLLELVEGICFHRCIKNFP